MKAYLSPLVGTAVWLAAWLILRPGPFDVLWAKWLLMLAPLVLVPLGLMIVRRGSIHQSNLLIAAAGLQLPAAALLGYSLVLAPGTIAALLAAPWLLVTGLIAAAGCLHGYRQRRGELLELCLGAALLFIFIGGNWAVLDRLGIRPLGFEPVIVLLTAIHFHYAGFVLPLTTGLAIRALDGRWPRVAGMLVLAGVPLVAVGITATQLKFVPWLESLAAITLAAGGVLTSCLHFRLARRSTRTLQRCFWRFAATSLLLSMLLAALYGLRFYLPLAWLDIPWMRALHGTANALGFALPVLLGWTIAKCQSS